MGDKTGISWTDSTWAPARGCSRVSEGCRNCYAERIAARFSKPGQAFHGFAQVVAPRDHLDAVGGRRNGWTRKVEFQPDQLAVPLRWKRPRRIFCSSMTDIFHESLTNEEIAAIFGVMAACPQHTFQVLTKRAKRMREWFETPGIADLVDKFRHIALAGRIEEFFADDRIAPIEGWPGYLITSKGAVLSDNKGRRQELKPMSSEQGHARVMLYRDGSETERHLIHRLVLAAFDKPQPNSVQACHIDGDASNNALWNLRWGTQSENWDDSKRHGTRRRYSKLTDEQVVELRRLGAEGISGAELGRRFGVSDTQARNILTGKQWMPEYKFEWPLASVWLGVRVENQDHDDRIRDLLCTPAAVRFLSCEPLLGALDLTGFLGTISVCAECTCGEATSGPAEAGASCDVCAERPALFTLRGIDWVIAGCESGPGARPCDVAWLRSLRDQTAAAGVPYFLKQARDERSEQINGVDASGNTTGITCGAGSKRKAGGVIELPYLDGVQHAAFPARRA